MRISDWSSDVCSSDLYERIERAVDTRRRRRGVPEQSEAGLDTRRAIDRCDMRGLGIGEAACPRAQDTAPHDHDRHQDAPRGDQALLAQRARDTPGVKRRDHDAATVIATALRLLCVKGGSEAHTRELEPL